MRNVETADTILRIVVGLGVISLLSVGPKTSWAWLGLMPLATALLGWCPLYSVLRTRTRQRLPAV